MENKFKFGDIVRSKVNPLKNKGIIVGDGTNEYMKNVWWDCAEESLHGEEIVSLELIPHADTVRLEYMGKLVAESMGMKYDPEEHRRQIDKSMEG